MKLWTILYFVITLSGAAFAQKLTVPPTLEQTLERCVFGGYVDGQGYKQMRRAGDSSAIALIRVISDRELTNDQIEIALSILDFAFSDPSLIESLPDREPKATLLVLRYLDLYTSDSALRVKIAESRRRIVEHAGKPSPSGM